MPPDAGAPSLTLRVRRAALALGFDAVGMAPAEALIHGDEFLRWLEAQRHGEMAWLARDPERRIDPRRLDNRIRSVVTVGMSYWQGGGTTSDNSSLPAGPTTAASGGSHQSPVQVGAPRGRIARYARGADYHNVLGRKLRKLLKHLRETEPGLDGRWYVDTGPVMDRAWAARSGVGWWGKHTNLVSREHGSWLLLGTLLLNRELIHERAPHDDFCGTCRRCIDVCPTRAITAERELDARLCISYLTIEHRGPIPRELRPAIGDWIFGCDLCLEVCPWNRFAEMSRESRFAAREDRDAPWLIPLLDLTDEAFRRKFNGSPIQRARREGFVRNVTVALGNVGGPESIDPLIRAMTGDESPLVRGHAAWALGRIAARLEEIDDTAAVAAASRARAALVNAADPDAYVSEEIEAARSAM